MINFNEFFSSKQLIKEGYPERVCDYCQLQLNTFHAFVRKAKITSNQFENMIQELKQSNDEDIEPNDTMQSSEMLSTNDMEFDIPQDDDVHLKSTNQSIEVEFLVDKTNVELTSDGNIIMPVNGDDGLYTNIPFISF